MLQLQVPSRYHGWDDRRGAQSFIPFQPAPGSLEEREMRGSTDVLEPVGD
jgi:hypothetical protein